MCWSTRCCFWKTTPLNHCTYALYHCTYALWITAQVALIQCINALWTTAHLHYESKCVGTLNHCTFALWINTHMQYESLHICTLNHCTYAKKDNLFGNIVIYMNYWLYNPAKVYAVHITNKIFQYCGKSHWHLSWSATSIFPENWAPYISIYK